MALYFKWFHNKSNDFGEIATIQITVLVADDLLQMCKFGPCNFRCCQCAMNCQLHYYALYWMLMCSGTMQRRLHSCVEQTGHQKWPWRAQTWHPNPFWSLATACSNPAWLSSRFRAWHLESVNCWGRSVPVLFSASVILCEDEPLLAKRSFQA